VIIRTLVVWLLALALPMQGVAAATLVFCGQASHHERHQAVAAGVVHADVHSHANAEVAASAATAATAAIHGGDCQPASAEGHTCSACAACCSVGAMLSPVPTVPMPDSAPIEFLMLVRAIGAFVADGLDRPPRRVFA
jgi:hypothetical protein